MIRPARLSTSISGGGGFVFAVFPFVAGGAFFVATFAMFLVVHAFEEVGTDHLDVAQRGKWLEQTRGSRERRL